MGVIMGFIGEVILHSIILATIGILVNFIFSVFLYLISMIINRYEERKRKKLRKLRGLIKW